MKRRLFAFLLALCLILNMASGIAFAEGEETGHTPGTQVTVTEATCTSEGKWAIYCTDEDCGIELETGVIPMEKHVPEQERCQNDVIEATCTQEGRNWLHCTNCKNLIFMENGEYIIVDSKDPRITFPKLPHNFVTYDAVAPDCLTEGHNEYTECTVCGAFEEGHEKVVEEALGHGEGVKKPGYVHNWEQYDAEKHVDDSVAAICSVCGADLVDPIVMWEEHSWENKEGLAATCETAGYSAYRVCTVCGYIDGYADIPALGHDFTKWVGALAGSCTEPGRLAGLVCAICGETPDEELGLPGAEWLPVVGHTVEIIPAVDPTCTSLGSTQGEKCSVCGEILVYPLELPMLQHDFSIVLGTKATCTTDGVGAHKLCDDCGLVVYLDENQKIIPAHGHSNVVGYWPETEEYAGVAGDVRTKTWTIITDERVYAEATCLTDGYKPEERCAFCKDVVVESVVTPALGHDWEILKGNEGVLPTCTETGISDLWTCSRCDAWVGGQTIQARGHKMEAVAEVLPTCYTDGHFAYDYCTVCGFATNAEYNEEPTADNHYIDHMYDERVGADVAKITLVETKRDLVTMATPDEFVVDAYNHKYFDVVKPLAPTCTENGIDEGATRCLVCPDHYEGLIVIPALGHDVVTVKGKAADCVNAGLKDYFYCDRCGKACEGTTAVLSFPQAQDMLTASEIYMPEEGDPAEFVIAALGHVEKDGIALAPTCHEDGHTAGKFCERCEITLEASEVIDALGCDYTVEVYPYVAPTCTEGGQEALMECVRCACTIGGGVIPALGHDAGEVTERVEPTCTEWGYTEGVHCTKCEIDYEPVKEYLLGLGAVDAEDLYEAGWLVVPQKIAAREHKLLDGTPYMTPVLNKDPECEEIGYLNYSECKYEDCDYHVGSIREALGHVWYDVPGGEETAPTCTEAGTDGIHQCYRCRETEAIVVPALGHDWVYVDAVAATCAADGNIEYHYCSRCDLHHDAKDNVITAADTVVADDGLHDDLWHVDAQMATCKTPGHSDGQECKVCGYNNFTEIAPDAAAYHQYLKDNMEALIAEGKLEWVTTAPFDENVPGSGMVSVLCPEGCGYIVAVKLWPEVQMGDVNMDGFVDVVDALMILQYEAGVIKSLPNEKAANFYVDEFIDSLDALAILNSLVN